MSEATRDLFMEWFQRFGATLRDDEYEGVIEALAEHDRQVAARAWDEGQKAGLLRADFEYGAIGYQHVRDNPYLEWQGNE